MIEFGVIFSILKAVLIMKHAREIVLALFTWDYKMGIIYHLFFNVISLNYYNAYLYKNSEECWCSDNQNYRRLGTKTDCNKACNKDNKQTCGNGGTMQIYKLPIIRKFY